MGRKRKTNLDSVVSFRDDDIKPPAPAQAEPAPAPVEPAVDPLEALTSHHAPKQRAQRGAYTKTAPPPPDPNAAQDLAAAAAVAGEFKAGLMFTIWRALFGKKFEPKTEPDGTTEQDALASAYTKEFIAKGQVPDIGPSAGSWWVIIIIWSKRILDEETQDVIARRYLEARQLIRDLTKGGKK